jgi:hypothetical protein
MTTTPTGSPGDELRAYYGCAELTARTGLDAVPAYDENGRATGLVAIDPDALGDWLDNYLDEQQEED